MRRGWGIAVAYKNTGLGGGAPDKANAEVELYKSGRFEVRTSSAELGQGLVTVLQMIIAEEFGVPASHVDVLVMDTDLTPDGGPTTASRQTFVTGNAALYAARTLQQAVRPRWLRNLTNRRRVFILLRVWLGQRSISPAGRSCFNSAGGRAATTCKI